MTEYKFKRGYKPEADRIKGVLTEIFLVEPVVADGKMVVEYGAIKELKTWVQDTKLVVETESNRSVSDEKVILDTNKRFRDFLEEATGYTAKERLKQAKKDVAGE